MLSYGYDDAGNRISIKHPDGNWFGMWYDALGRRYYIHANNVLGMAMLGFAPHGGLAWVGRVGIASYIGFDGVQRPATLAQTAYTPSASTDVAFSFARNPAGQITSLTRDNDAYAWTGHYAANRAYTANGLNQYSAAGNAAFGYDANGNLTSDGSRTYAYDIENRLVSSSNGAALTYDPLGRLYQVTLGTSTTRFLYDGDALVAEYDGSNTLIRRHAHWQGADMPVATFDVSGGTGLGTLRYLFADQQGSIIAEANGSGAVTTINRYDEYGIPASTNSGRFQYTGQAWLPEIGMYYYKARIYSPTLGRFMQTDPVGYQGGINLYGYVGDDPINATDPSGTVRCTGDPRCADVHTAAGQARTAAQDASTRLRGLAAAVRSGATLTSDQQSLLNAYQEKFGTGSGTASNLNAAAGRFDRIADRIGAQGSCMRVNFNASMERPASAPLNGRTLNIGQDFFNTAALNGATQAYVILHEGGHSAGLRDLAMPSGAPAHLGRLESGRMHAYGVGATNWLGTNRPSMAVRNNENYTCFAVGDCGAPY
jgi:RHS repeat-associated protein